MEEARQEVEPKAEEHEPAGQLEIIYYTDPLCCWSWAIEPQLRKIKFEYSGRITWRYLMGGLLPGWNNYHDEVNSVSRPLQMGPVWMHAQQISGMPMNSAIWMKDAPASSYSSCIAVKCAELQSPEAGDRYLRLLREAVMIHGLNIANENALIKIAGDLSEEPQYNFDLIRFEADLKNDNGLEAFRKDVQEVQYRNISRFPTMIIKSPWHKGLILTGYRPYSVLLESIKQVAPHLQKTNDVINENDYERFWGNLTKRETEEIRNSNSM